MVVEDYPVLRIMEKDGKFECELTEPNSMQVSSIELKISSKDKNQIISQYNEIIKIMALYPENAPSPTQFSSILKTLGVEIGKILNPILRKLAFEVEKSCSLALALDEQTSENPLGIRTIIQNSRTKTTYAFVPSGMYRQTPNYTTTFLGTFTQEKKKKKALVVGINYDDRPELGVLTRAEDEAEKISTTLERNDISVNRLIGKKATWDAVLSELMEGVDIFHFTGHGAVSWNKAKIFLNDKDLWAKDLNDFLKKSPAPSLSFFNACESSIDASKNGKVTWRPYSWAYAMAMEGGNRLIGTQWSVLEHEATDLRRHILSQVSRI